MVLSFILVLVGVMFCFPYAREKKFGDPSEELFSATPFLCNNFPLESGLHWPQCYSVSLLRYNFLKGPLDNNIVWHQWLSLIFWLTGYIITGIEGFFVFKCDFKCKDCCTVNYCKSE